MAHDETVFEPDAAWTRALEKYGAATHLAVELYGRDERLILGPVYPTRLFELLAPGHHALSMFAACVRRCLAQTAGASTIVVEQRHRFAVIGSSLAMTAKRCRCSTTIVDAPAVWARQRRTHAANMLSA